VGICFLYWLLASQTRYVVSIPKGQIMEKIVKDGRVAVLVSKGFGAGWSTWMNEEQADVLLFHPTLVQMVLEGKEDQITEDLCIELLGYKKGTKEHKECSIYVGGKEGLYVEWIPKGCQFLIKEYDGCESIQIVEKTNWRIA
jgi:hypothetical protein